MLRNRMLVFFSIIGLAIVFTVGVWVAEQNGVYLLPGRQVTAVPLEIVVAPESQDWVTAAAETFSQQNADAEITVRSASGLSSVEQFGNSSRPELPQIWMPEAAFIGAYAQDLGLPFAIGESIYQVDLAWGAFEDRAETLDSLSWEAVHDAAKTGDWQTLGGDPNWGYFKLTIASPKTDTEGLAALISAAASYHDTATLDRSHIADAAFQTWLRTIVLTVPNFNTLGPDPAQSMAARGPSVGDVGLLTGHSWANAQTGLTKWGGFVTQAPRYTVQLDYPYLLRDNLSDQETAIARRFQNALTEYVEQVIETEFNALSNSGSEGVQVDSDVIKALIQWVERERIGG